MEGKKIINVFRHYIDECYNILNKRFSLIGIFDSEENTISFKTKSDVCSEVHVKFLSEGVQLYIYSEDGMYKELRKHQNFIRDSYNISIGNNPKRLCELQMDEVDWDNDSSMEKAFDWIVFNMHLLQDISDRYAAEIEDKNKSQSQKENDGIAVRRIEDDKYETKKVFAQTNSKTGIRYKIIHRKSKNRFEIWNNNNGERHRINNADVERIKTDKDAMIKYIKDNLLQ